jgi:hypothetical protein
VRSSYHAGEQLETLRRKDRGHSPGTNDRGCLDEVARPWKLSTCERSLP